MLKIRTAGENDLEKIMQIEKASFVPQIQENQNVFFERIKSCPKLFLIFYDSDEDFYDSNEENRSESLSYENSENIAGYLCAELFSEIPQNPEELQLGHLPQKILSDDSLKNNLKTQYFIYISSFAIFPSKRGNGYGKKCWNLAMEYFKNMNFEQNNAIIKGFLLLVNELWTKALSIYEKSGFEKIKTFKNFFVNDENSFSDGILMKLDF